MKSLTALIKREYLEHRGAFLYAPAVILVVLAFIMFSGAGFGRFDFYASAGALTGDKGFEFAFLAASALWSFYLLATLFFYYADAFSADGRNNAMLFWKSMPQSDFKILASKMLAGLTVFPALIVGALLVSALIAYLAVAFVLGARVGIQVAPSASFLSSAINVFAFDLAYLVLALLWYAPFFAWVGLLSTLFRRWSIPLAFLVPAIAGLAENLLFRNLIGARDAGYILGFLRQRLDFGVGRQAVWDALQATQTFDAAIVFNRMLAEIDWSQLVGGVGVAFLLVFVASEYRRRFVAT